MLLCPQKRHAIFCLQIAQSGRKGASLLCHASSSSFVHALDNQRLTPNFCSSCVCGITEYFWNSLFTHACACLGHLTPCLTQQALPRTAALQSPALCSPEPPSTFIPGLPIFQAHGGQVSDKCHYCIWLAISAPQFLIQFLLKYACLFKAVLKSDT